MDFKGIFDNIDLQYNTIGNKVKENIIINKPTDKTDFTFNINVKNLIPKLQKDNSIIFYDSKQTDKVIFTMKVPFMYDSKLAFSDKIKMNLIEAKEGYTLALSADKEWINSADRAYPITIDPDVETSQSVSDIKDTFVASNDATDKYNNIYLRVGQNVDVGTTRSYLKFNLPAITSADMVIYSQLNLTSLSQNNGGGVSQINAYEATSSWGGTTAQGLSWSNQPSSGTTISDYAMVDRTYSGWNSWSITDIVKKWYTTGNNNGLMLKANNESSGDITFLSSDCGDGWAAHRPFISITYINNSGLESYWTYHSQDAKRAGTGYINDYNGNLVFEHDDLNTGGNKLPVAIKHVYNNNDKHHYGYGLGWRLNYSQRFEYNNIEGKGYYIYTDEDGTKHYFLASSSNQIQDELNLGLTLIIETNNTYTIKDKKSNIVNFWNSGGIRYIADSNGNCIDVSYGTAANGATILTTLTEEGSGRTTKLNYYPYGSIQEIVDSAGRKTSFEYDGAGNLYKITYPDGNHSTYTYDGSNNLTSAINYDGYKISYEYYNAGVYRVKKALESHTDGTLGGELNVSYGNNSTSFTDVKGRKEIYQFDYSGKTVSVKAPDGTADYYSYDSSNITKMGMSSKLQSTISNILLNHSAEKDANWTFASDGGQGTAGYTSEDKYIGNRSIKISKSDNVSRHYAQEVLPLVPGKTYTFSAYTKTSNISSSNNGGAFLAIYYINSAGAYEEVATKCITGTNDWGRMQLTFTLPSDISSTNVIMRVGLQLETGTADFDALQLEEGSAANRYNLVENGDFTYGAVGCELPDGWTIKDNFDGNDVLTTNADSRFTQNTNNNCFTISGNATIGKDLGQTINVSGKKGDNFVLGGWAKGDSIPLYNSRNFALYIAFFNGGTRTQADVAIFNTDSSDWQFVSKNIVANADYTSVSVYTIYNFNANRAYFDGIQLYKEEFGTSYQYDAKGNVVSTASLAQQNSKFEYNGTDDLITSTDSKGNQFKYEYDNNSGSGKHSLTKATSAENVVYSFSYDKNGNPLTAKVGDSATFIQSSATYTPSGNYLSSITDASGNTTTYNHDEAKNTLTSVVDSKGNTTNYGYDNLNRLTSVTKNVDGQAITNSYGYKNDRIETIVHNGFSYNFGYDSLGSNTTVAVGSQNLITNSYEARTGKLLESTYGNGQKVSNDYDSNDKVTDKKYNGNIRYSYQYDGNNNLAYQKDLVNGVDYKYQYDLSDRLINNIDSANNSIRYSYDLNNNISSITENINGSNFSTRYSYDKDNKPVSINYDRGYVSSKLSRSLVAYYSFDNNDISDSSGNGNNGIIHGAPQFVNGIKGKAVKLDGVKDWIELTDFSVPETFSISLWVNPYTINDGQLFMGKHTSTGGNILWLGYYGGGYDLEVNSAEYYDQGTKTTGYQHIVAVITKLNSTQSDVKLYKNGNLLWQKTLNDVMENTKGRAWVLGQDWDGDTLSDFFNGELDEVAVYKCALSSDDINYIYNAKDTSNIVSYSYDSLGRLTNKSTGAANNQFKTSYSYVSGVNGSSTNKIGDIDNNGTKIFYTYDKNGNIETITQGGKIIKYYYNELNELTREDNQIENKTITYSYDVGGNIRSKVEYNYTNDTPANATKSYNYAYGDSNWKDKLTNYDGKDITYDQIGNPLNYNGYNYTWEQGRQLKSISGNNQNISYKYNDNGIRTEKNVNGIVTKYHLDGDKVTYENNEYYTYKYNYSQNNTWTYHGFDIPVNIGKSYTYSFDALISIDANISNTGSTFIANGEIGFPASFYYDNTKKGTWQHFESTQVPTTNTARLLMYPTTSQIPATTGYIIFKNVQFREVNSCDNLFTQPIDNNGFSVRGNGIFECAFNKDDNTIYYTYDSSDNLVSMNLNGVEYYYIRNAQGDIIGLFDKTGAQVVSYTYDTWGKLISIDGSLKDTVGVKNPYRYRGYRYDTETGLYYLQSRYYNPEWGRFINADGIIGHIGTFLLQNMFAYC